MRRFTSPSRCAGALLALALAGCNTVMGIDEAQLRTSETTGGTSSAAGAAGFSSDLGAVPQLSSSCAQPSPACASCIAAAGCDTLRTKCLGDARCRSAHKSYRVCLGSQCQDREQGCLNQLVAHESSLALFDSLGFAECVQGECLAECANVPLASPCELYCGCMTPTCVSDLASREPQPFALGPDCVTQCEQQLASDITCRWTHCEMRLIDEKGGHCAHAIGETFCNSTASLPACTDKSQSTFACNEGKDCCSNKCTRHVCD